MITCPRCGELVTGERARCPACDYALPNASSPWERRLRGLIIAAFVIGGLWHIAELVRHAFVRP